MAIEDAIGNSQEDVKDSRIIGGPPEEMAAKDAADAGRAASVQEMGPQTPAGALTGKDPEPELSETSVIEGEQATLPPLTHETRIDALEQSAALVQLALKGLCSEDYRLNQRIDKIVEAISKSKSVVNL